MIVEQKLKEVGMSGLIGEVLYKGLLSMHRDMERVLNNMAELREELCDVHNFNYRTQQTLHIDELCLDIRRIKLEIEHLTENAKYLVKEN